jgi:hypothetical protein
MPHTSPTRYAVVSCHVERPLDDLAWARFRALQRARPGGLAIAALVRPPDAAAGEDEQRWLERARETAAAGPFGHHVHWTSPTHARPTGGDPSERVRREGAWLREQGLAPTLFCGGGWYTDARVAAACADLGYVDCTPRARRPGYLPADAAWAELDVPAAVSLPGGRSLRCVPTTHALGDLASALLRPAGPAEDVVHVYFHDTDLLHRPRRSGLVWALRLLARRRRAADLDALAAGDTITTQRTWQDVARGGAAIPQT